MKNVRVILSPEAEEVFNYLNERSLDSKFDRTILNAVKKKVELIKSNFQYGDPVSKHLIPADYVVRYGITNLFRVELPNYWRMLYSVVDGETEIEIIGFVLDIIDHDDYNKKIGYKKK